MSENEHDAVDLLTYWAERMDRSDMLPDPKWMAELFRALACELIELRANPEEKTPS